MNARRGLVTNAVGLAVLFWGLFWCLRRSEYERAPVGDAAYYTQMTWSFFSGQRQAVPISAIHSRRVLGPFLAAVLLKAGGIDTSPAYEFPYNPFSRIVKAWGPGQRRAVGQIEAAWTFIDFISYLALAAAIGCMIPPFLDGRAALALTAALLLIPCMGLLYVYWPEMNDPLALALGAVGCALLCRERKLPGFAVLGASALAREEVLILIPLLLLLRRPKRLWACLLTSVGPYALVAAVPVFPNVQPLLDNSTQISQKAANSFGAYLSLLAYHQRYLFSYKGLAQPAAFALNLGPLLLLRMVLGIPSAKLFWPVAALGLVLVADRHMVLLNLPLLLMLASAKPKTMPKSGTLLVLLTAWVAAVLGLLAAADNALVLQAENWFRFLSPSAYLIGMSSLTALLIAVLAWGQSG